MTNVKTEVKGDQLVITVNLNEDHGPSASGKTTIIASTNGNQSVQYKGQDFKIGLNVFKPKK
jgi:hypothetical protein